MKRIFALLLALMLGISGGFAEETPEFEARFDGRIFAYNGPGGMVSVPSVIGDQAICGVYRSAFANNSTITFLDLEEGLQSLGSGATYRMAGLADVILPDTLVAIDDTNFTSCGALTELSIPAGVRYIGDNCFNWNERLTSVTFEGPPPVMGESSFTQVSADFVAYVPEDQMEAYRAVLPSGVSLASSGREADTAEFKTPEADFDFDAETGAVRAYLGHDAYVLIPAKIGGKAVKSVGDYAFEGNFYPYCVELPEGLESIGERAFRNAANLAWVHCPDSLKSIGERAFENFHGTINWSAGLEEIGRQAFVRAELPASQHFPDSLKVIRPSAFQDAKLEEAYFPAGLESIEENAFAGVALRYLYFDGFRLPQIAPGAFDSSAQVDLNAAASRQQAADAQESLSGIGWAVRVGRGPNPDLQHDQAGQSTYADGLFTGYTGEITNLLPWDAWEGLPTTGIAAGALRGNRTVTSFGVPHNDQCVSIGAEAFASSALEKVDLFDSVTVIGEGAFRDCVNLTEIVLPASVTFVGENAFSGCANLRSVTVLCDPAILPRSAFRGCEGIETFTGREGAGEAEQTALLKALGKYRPIDPEDFARLGGEWHVYSVLLSGYTLHPADLQMNGLLTLQIDGTYQLDRQSGENAAGDWRVQDGQILLSLEDQPTGALDIGENTLFLRTGETMEIFSRTENPVPAWTAPAQIEATDIRRFYGIWQAVSVSAAGRHLPVEFFLDTWPSLFGSEDTTLMIRGSTAALFGQPEEACYLADGLLRILREGEIQIRLHEDGTLSVRIQSIEIFCRRIGDAPEPTPAPTPKPTPKPTAKPTAKKKTTATPKPTAKKKTTATPKPTAKKKSTATPKPSTKKKATATPKRKK